MFFLQINFPRFQAPWSTVCGPAEQRRVRELDTRQARLVTTACIVLEPSLAGSDAAKETFEENFILVSEGGRFLLVTPFPPRLSFLHAPHFYDTSSKFNQLTPQYEVRHRAIVPRDLGLYLPSTSKAST